MLDAYMAENDPEIKADIKKRLEEAREIVKKFEKLRDDLETTVETEKSDFMRFALEFIDNLGSNFIRLSPGNAEKCKQILFPDGFWVDNDKNVYTHAISPIYGYRNQKNPVIITEFPVWCEWRESNPRPKFGKLIY